MQTREDLFNKINEHDRCKACNESDLYCATYVGPLYCSAKPKILFIGLDHGRETHNITLRQRQTEMIEWASKERWNQHYEGCVKVASYLLGSACLDRCTTRCALGEDISSHTKDNDCVLIQFAQGNAVKCVPPGKKTMSFTAEAYKRIPACLPLMFDELTVLRPEVIVLQGADLDEPFRDFASKQEDMQMETTAKKDVWLMVWPTFRSILVSLNHPGMGHLKKDWNVEIVPYLEEAKQHL